MKTIEEIDKKIEELETKIKEYHNNQDGLNGFVAIAGLMIEHLEDVIKILKWVKE